VLSVTRTAANQAGTLAAQTGSMMPSNVTRPNESCADDANRDAREQEALLVAGMLAGQHPAWRDFQVRYDRLIYRCITKVTVRFSTKVTQEDVREIYAAFLLQLLANDMHKLRTFDPERGNRFASWIGLLAVNAAYDYLRSVRRDANRAPLTEAENLTSDDIDPYSACEQRERAEHVASLLRAFSEKDREFMELYFGEGLSPEEVASRMNISVKTVYSKKHKIQSRLEEMMGRRAA
jgi:RNA polymerase sigma-70 factor, ECF subfamily